MKAKNVVTQQDKTTQSIDIIGNINQAILFPSSPINLDTLISKILVQALEKSGNVADEVVDITDYLFSISYKELLKREPKKMKFDEKGKEIAIAEGHDKVMVWRIANQNT